MQAGRGIEQGGGPQPAKTVRWTVFSPRVFPYGSYKRKRLCIKRCRAFFAVSFLSFPPGELRRRQTGEAEAQHGQSVVGLKLMQGGEDGHRYPHRQSHAL